MKSPRRPRSPGKRNGAKSERVKSCLVPQGPPNRERLMASSSCYRCPGPWCCWNSPGRSREGLGARSSVPAQHPRAADGVLNTPAAQLSSGCRVTVWPALRYVQPGPEQLRGRRWSGRDTPGRATPASCRLNAAIPRQARPEQLWGDKHLPVSGKAAGLSPRYGGKEGHPDPAKQKLRCCRFSRLSPACNRTWGLPRPYKCPATEPPTWHPKLEQKCRHLRFLLAQFATKVVPGILGQGETEQGTDISGKVVVDAQRAGEEVATPSCPREE